MRKIGKMLLFMFVFNLIASFSIFGYLGFSLVAPSLEGTELTVFDLFKKDIESEKLAKFEENMMERSDKLGKKTGAKIVNCLEKLFPSPDFDYSKIPAPEYPYPSADEVLEMQNQQAQEGIKEGLQILDQTEQKNKAYIEKGLKILEESDKKQQIIKNSTLSEPNN